MKERIQQHRAASQIEDEKDIGEQKTDGNVEIKKTTWWKA